MSNVRALILRTSGTNCDFEIQYAFENVGATADRIHVSELIERRARISDYDILVLPGGFSYGDDIAAGRVHANELHFLLRAEIDQFLKQGGLALGVCNGFQCMVKMGLLPTVTPDPSHQRFSLVDNECGRFEDRWIRLKALPGRCVFVREEEIVEMPVAHGEGRFVATDSKLIDGLFDSGQVAFQYVSAGGTTAQYPDNPNGSYRGVAGVCDETGRILGLMPHPERHISPFSHPRHTREGLKKEGDGVRYFRNAVEYVRKEVR
ncbi:MAG: phosphoribosylformylglycinamidine synthase I [Candidatus Brocadiia bacterium]